MFAIPLVQNAILLVQLHPNHIMTDHPLLPQIKIQWMVGLLLPDQYYPLWQP